MAPKIGCLQGRKRKRDPRTPQSGRSRQVGSLADPEREGAALEGAPASFGRLHAQGTSQDV